MKTFKIAHLYYDLMNLYGENGNIRFLKKKLEEQGFNVEVHFLTIEDELNFDEFDFYYIGMGSKESQNLVLEDILKYKEKIKNSIKNGKHFLVTGNALDLFGKSFTNTLEMTTEALNIFDFESKEEEFRIVGPQYYNCDKIDKKIIGFQNRNTLLTNFSENALFNVIDGTGYAPSQKIEGITFNNFYGTYLIGPLLVRNPYFTDYLVKMLCIQKNEKYQEPNKEDYAYTAYNEYLNNFYKDK